LQQSKTSFLPEIVEAGFFYKIFKHGIFIGKRLEKVWHIQWGMHLLSVYNKDTIEKMNRGITMRRECFL